MKQKLFGMGAAGNKAAMLATESNIIEKENVILFNSTATDIPRSYDGQVIEFPGNVGGTGKDRNISKRQAKLAIDNKSIDLKTLLSDADGNQVDQVIFVTSTDGGSGSGSTTVIAEYIHKTFKMPVMIFAIIGRPKDIRGSRNTVEFFKEIGNKFTVAIIENKKVAEGPDDTNDSAIEAKANAEFCRELSLFLGNQIEDDNMEQNLDERELYKLRTTPGYTIMSTTIFDNKIKNIEQTRKEVAESLDNICNPDPDNKDMARLGLVYNCDREESSFMDVLPVIKDKFGLAFEVFTHRQYNNKSPRIVGIIMAGLAMPMKEIQDIYEEYKEATSMINKQEDNFFNSIKTMEFDDSDSFFEGDDDIDSLLGL
ncbi:MAG: hypothetical protein PHC62_00060 [Candidatus Izemoplasmatales bacterium]|nr:hypothetical protein [Candidatus Izemoplasmatales bacterium]